MKTLQKVILVLSFVVVLPSIFYSVYELSSMNKDEELILEIYENQLDALLFSGNQYSNDITAGWISMVEDGWDDTTNISEGMPTTLLKLLQLNPSIKSVRIKHINDSTINSAFTLNEDTNINALKRDFNQLVQQQTKVVNRLVGYKESGFQKLEPIQNETDSTNTVNLLFVVTQRSNSPVIAGIELDALAFIRETMAPKLQTIAQEKFIFTVHNRDTKAIVYSTSDTTLIKNPNERELIRDFWILPKYYLSIDLVGDSLDSIIRKRTYTNLGMLLALDAMLILGVWLIFRNVKRELHLAQSKSDFVSNVSHEIRTPLALISMFAETLEMNRVKTEEKKHEYYQIISKETNRLTGIVNKILSFSQMEAQKKNFSLKNIELTEAIKEVLATYEFHLKNKGFECTTVFTDNLIIKADKEAIHEVFVNLLDNAMKYSDGTKKIEISTGKTTEEAYLKVKDFGVGISKKDQKHIFDKFYRVSSGDLAKSKGTGLGLSLVKQIIDEHQARIDLDSELGKGSTFSVYFPLNN